MKMTRDQLKKIIKECLVEILLEGAGEVISERVSRSHAAQVPQRQVPSQQARRQTVFDMMHVRGQQKPQPQRASQVNEMVSIATRDPLMASILADTAQTTLVEQESNGRAPTSGGDQAARVVSAYDPTEIFGEEQTIRWNEAAFAPRQRLPGVSGLDTRPDYDPYAPVKNA